MLYKLPPFINSLLQPIFWRMHKWYFSIPRWYKYDDIKIRILPTVFHPGFFISTKVLLKYIISKNLQGKKLIELGAGSGLISLYTTKQGAITTATDINPIAIQALKESSKKNDLTLSIVESDLFEKIEVQHFDYIIINPPYFPKDPADDWEKAFFCGSNFEYFHKLFDQIRPYSGDDTKSIMILNENCNIKTILSIASNYSLTLNLIESLIILREKQYIFEIHKQAN